MKDVDDDGLKPGGESGSEPGSAWLALTSRT